ncbi:MAG: hypothetical protein U0V75_10420 [Ferruginibacter sp.]
MKSLIVFCLFLLSLVFVQFAQAQTVDEVIDKYINAIGGKEKLMAIKTIKMTGNLNVQGFDVGVVTTASHGVGVRTDISVPGMGEGFQIMTPTKGWGFMPFQGQTAPEEVGEDQVKAGQNSLDLQGPLLNYKEKGSTVELLGKEKAEGKDCFKLKLTNKFGKVTTIFIDATDYYRIKSVSTANINGEETEVETVYSDFKKDANGYVFAYAQTSPRGTINYSTIEVNIAVDEKIFKPQ